MFAIRAATLIFVATGATDQRKGCNGLFSLLRAQWERDALGGGLYWFCNRRRDVLKIFSGVKTRCGTAPRGWSGAHTVGRRQEYRR